MKIDENRLRSILEQLAEEGAEDIDMLRGAYEDMVVSLLKGNEDEILRLKKRIIAANGKDETLEIE